MSLHDEAKYSERQDRQRLVFALFLFLAGLAAGLQALEFFYHRHDFPLINLLHNALLLSQVLLVLYLVINLVRLIGLARNVACNRGMELVGSFVGKTSLYALSASWFFTWFMAITLTEWTDPIGLFHTIRADGALLPAPYYFQFLLCCMLLSYSVSFFVLYWRDGADEREAQA